MAAKTIQFQGRGYGNKRAQLCIATIFAKGLELDEVDLDNADFCYDVARDDTSQIFEKVSMGPLTTREIMEHALTAGIGTTKPVVAEFVPGTNTLELLTQVSLQSPCAGVISFEDERAVAFYIDDSNPEAKTYKIMNPEQAQMLEFDTLCGPVPNSLEFELYKLAQGGQLKLDFFIMVSPPETTVLEAVKTEPVVEAGAEPVTKKRKGTTRSKTVKKKDKDKDKPEEESVKE